MSLLRIDSSIDIPTNVNLTTKGTLDWAHWNLVDETSFNHKAGVTQQISDVTLLDAAHRYRRLAGAAPYFAWTDGTPTASASQVDAQMYTRTLNNRYQITCPAAAATRVLTVYCQAIHCTITYAASLSDSSASPVTTTVVGPAGGIYRAIALSFNASAANVTLTVTLQMTAESDPIGTMAMMAAALEPAAGPLSMTLNPSDPSQTVAAGTAITPITVSAAGGAAPYTITASGLPAGLSAVQTADSALISGTPSSPGDAIGFATVADAAGKVLYSNSFSIRVLPANVPRAVWLGR